MISFVLKCGSKHHVIELSPLLVQNFRAPVIDRLLQQHRYSPSSKTDPDLVLKQYELRRTWVRQREFVSFILPRYRNALMCSYHTYPCSRGSRTMVWAHRGTQPGGERPVFSNYEKLIRMRTHWIKKIFFSWYEDISFC